MTVGRCPKALGEGRGTRALPPSAQPETASPALLSLSFAIKGNGTEPGLGPGAGLDWAVALELSGVMEASCFAVEGGQGSGDASASLSQRKLQELLWGWNSWARGPTGCVCAA